MKHAHPLITVVVVTLNSLTLLRNCLRSLYTQDYEAIEIVVVDNGSDEDIKGLLSEEFPDIHMIRLEKNHGFAGGNNRGIEIASGKYIALINNDALASPQWLSSMVETAESDRRTGAVASIIIDGNSPDVLDSCGVGIGMDGMSRQAMRGRPVPELTQPKEVLLFSGCACLLRMEALNEVGLFDEDFFAYCEDTDLGLRLQRAGWKIVVAPNAYVEHYYSMTGGKFSLQKVYWVERNHFWVAIRNFPWVLLIFIPFFTIFRYFVQGYSVVKGEGELNKFTKNTGIQAIVSVYVRAYVDMFKKMPVMLSRRLCFDKRRKVSDLGMLNLIWKFHLTVSEIIGINKR